MEAQGIRPIRLARDINAKAGDWVALVGDAIYPFDLEGLALVNKLVDPEDLEEPVVLKESPELPPHLRTQSSAPPRPPRPPIVRVNRLEEIYAVFVDYRPRNNSEIALQLGLKPDLVSWWLRRLVALGRITRLARGLYAKVAPQPQQPPHHHAPPPAQPPLPMRPASNGEANTNDIPF